MAEKAPEENVVQFSRLGYHSGVLPDHRIVAMAEEGHIRADESIEENQYQPASLDLRLGSTAYRIRASFLPGAASSVDSRVAEFSLHKFSIEQGAILETGCVYLIPLIESLALPDDLHAAANPKSSTGRLDVFTRLICDNAATFDTIPVGYSGRLYAEVAPRTFSIVVRRGSRLNQIRLRRGGAALADDELMRLHRKAPITGSDPMIRNGLGVRVSLTPTAGRLIGFRAKRHAELLDVDAVGRYDPGDFWDALQPSRNGQLILDPDQFYILASKNAVAVPPTHAAEMAAFDPLMGEYRVHYAGFFDPGFGRLGSDKTSRAVLEVRSREVPFMLTDGQVIARLIYEQLTDLPRHLYGHDRGSHYQDQGLKLGKQFKPYVP